MVVRPTFDIFSNYVKILDSQIRNKKNIKANHLTNIIFQKLKKIGMDNLKNFRLVTSPPQTTNSPVLNTESRQSIVLSRNNTFAIAPTKLDFKSSRVQTKFTNISMIQSQVVNNSGNAFYPNLKSSGINSNGLLSDRFNNTISNSRVADPMKESTVSYMRSIYRGIPNLSQERLRAISQNFLRLYGTDREITQNGLKNIQREAHQNEQFQHSSQTIGGLIKILDANKDKKITEDDILTAARRYLSFDRKQIVYTPMVEERLAVARRLFKQFDVERKGYLTQKQVPNLLSQTYRCLGKTFTATPEDIKSWMKLTDGDGDGHVTLPEYEQSIIRALKKQGVRIYDQ